jgi:hypothetical protein
MQQPIPIDLVRLVAVMRQGDKSTKYLNRTTGAILDGGDLERLRRGLDADGIMKMMSTMIEVPKTDSRTVFQWMREWLNTDAQKLPDPRFVDDLLDTLNGDGAFRRFKNALSQPGRGPWSVSWDGYRHKMLCERARLWLAQSGIEYRELDTSAAA